jgi:uncharacterized protein YcbK (DUF882 family)
MIFDFSKYGFQKAVVGIGLKLFAKAITYATLSCSILAIGGAPATAAGETRSISLYHTNTKESLTVTYKVNGQYVPSAMKKLNYLLRDWRRNQVITIDPKVIDLVWELHADLGSKAPINIVCGYRTAATNGFLRRFGRGVAKKSQHISGKAIDINFPDVPTKRIRNIALVHQFGGVGYYPTSGPRGFVHVDSGNVRQWGPAISGTEMAQIFNEGRKVVAARLSRGGNVAVASNLIATKPINISPVYDEVDITAEQDLASLSEKASKAPVISGPKLIQNTSKMVALNNTIPKPRLKPKELQVATTEDLIIQPASAPPPTQVLKSNHSDVAVVGSTTKAVKIVPGKTKIALSESEGEPVELLRKNPAKSTPAVQPILASADGSNINWWPEFSLDGQSAIRRNGTPTLIGTVEQSQLALAAELSAEAADPTGVQTSAEGKGDLLVVNSDGKGDLIQVPLN